MFGVVMYFEATKREFYKRFFCAIVASGFCFVFSNGAIANTDDIAVEILASPESGAATASLGSIYYLMTGITIFSLILAAVASFVSIKFYMWRQTIDLQGALVPEQWAGSLKELSTEVQRQAAHLIELTEVDAKLARIVQSVGQENIKEGRSIKEILLEFRQSLDSKDQEIVRLKQGYDLAILKKFLVQLAILHEQCKNILVSDPNNKSLINFEILLRDNLESSGAEIENISKGVDFAELGELVEVVGYTHVSAQDLKMGEISEVLSSAYVYRIGERTTVLRKAKIKYYVPEELE
jgi:hypothetical protein